MKYFEVFEQKSYSQQIQLSYQNLKEGKQSYDHLHNSQQYFLLLAALNFKKCIFIQPKHCKMGIICNLNFGTCTLHIYQDFKPKDCSSFHKTFSCAIYIYIYIFFFFFFPNLIILNQLLEKVLRDYHLTGHFALMSIVGVSHSLLLFSC